jgi:hypothetical protein
MMVEQAIAMTIPCGLSWLRGEGVGLNNEDILSVAYPHRYGRCRFLYSSMPMIHLYIGV